MATRKRLIRPTNLTLPSLHREGNIKNLPQRISCYRKAASEHISKSIVHYVTGVGECGQRTCSTKDAGGPLESSVMNDQIYQRIEDSARFRELVEKRQRFATILSIIMLAVYISFILLIAFAPGWPGYSATRGNQRHPRYSDWSRSDPHLLHPDRDLHLAGKR